jgi:flavodoxin
MHAIVVYYSRTGMTEHIANLIGKAAQVPVVRLETATPYLTHEDTVMEGAAKDLRNNAMPALKPMDIAWNTYDTLFIGTPNWYGTFAPPITTFLDTFSCAGKTIIPFCTHDGTHGGNIAQDLKNFCPKANVLSCFEVDEHMGEDSIVAWLGSLGI